MRLAPGTPIGPYEILSAIGSGGMGEVYRARDSTLNRFVALKVLQELFARDPERLERFGREARMSSLCRTCRRLRPSEHSVVYQPKALRQTGDRLPTR